MHVYIKIGGIILLSKNGSKNCEKKVPKRGKSKRSIKPAKIGTKQDKKKWIFNKKLSSVNKNKLNFINFLEVFKKVQKRLKKWSKRGGGNFRLVNIENDHFLGGLFPTPLFRRLERSPIQFPIILALPRRVRDGSGPKFVIFWLSRGAPFWAPPRALLRALNSTIFNKFEKYSFLHKKVAQVVTSLQKILQNVYISWSLKVLKTTRFRRALFLQDLRPLFTQF